MYYEVDFSLNEATGFFQIYAVCVKIKLWRRYHNTAQRCTLIDNSSCMTPFTNILISMESPIIAACTCVISYIAAPSFPSTMPSRLLSKYAISIILIVVTLKPKSCTNKLSHRHMYASLPLYGVFGCLWVLKCVHS